MYFANPWGLLGLLALPAILAIHFFHRRYPPLVIAGAHLWGIDTEVQTIGRRWDRLPLSATLLFELLAALLLTMLLSQPRLGVLGTATHVVVVLDHSASMQAAPPNGDTFRDRVIDDLRTRMEELPGGSRVTVILSGPVPQTIVGPAARWEEAEPRLAEWQPRLPKHQFGPAWDLAAQFAGQSGELVFFTDHLPGEDAAGPAGMEIVAVGEELRNIAITTAEWTYKPDEKTTEVYLRAANFGQARASIDIKAESSDEEVFSKTISVGPGDDEPVQFEVPPGKRRLSIEIFSPADGLKLDNSLTLIEPKPRPVKVSVELPEGGAAREAVNRGLTALSGVEIVPPEEADLRIAAANNSPPSERDLWWLGIGPLDPSEAARESAVDLKGPYILKRRDPLVRGLALGTLIWGGVQPMLGQYTPLISCDQLPLLARLEGTLTMAYLLNIDMARSQLAAGEDWPILLSNLIELRRRSLPGLYRWNYRLNEIIRFRRPSEQRGAEWTIASENDSRSLVPGRRGLVEIDSLEQAGVYQLKSGERVLDRIAVNYFDATESDLSGLDAGVVASEAGDGELFKLDNPYSWMILLGLVLVLGLVIADWKTLQA